MNEISEQRFDDKIQGVENWNTRSKTSASATCKTQITYGVAWDVTLALSVRNQRLSRTTTAPQGEILKSGMNSEEFEEGRNNEVRYEVENGEYSYIHMGR